MTWTRYCWVSKKDQEKLSKGEIKEYSEGMYEDGWFCENCHPEDIDDVAESEYLDSDNDPIERECCWCGEVS